MNYNGMIMVIYAKIQKNMKMTKKLEKWFLTT